jgi:hypothetical protein
MIDSTDVMQTVINFYQDGQLPFTPEYNVLMLEVAPVQLAADVLIHQGFHQFEAWTWVPPVPVRKLHVKMGEAMTALSF